MKKCRVYDKHLKIIRDVKYIDFANEENATKQFMKFIDEKMEGKR